ncbi:hypothetical protein FI667_g14184, partial [Globisporangium splendens]
MRDDTNSSLQSSGSSVGSSTASDSDGVAVRQLHADDEGAASDKVLSCTVVHDHRFVRLRIAAHDTVESLLELTKIKLRKKYPNENLQQEIVGLRSQRLEKDLYLHSNVDDVILEGDILEVRPYTITALTASGSSRFSLACYYLLFDDFAIASARRKSAVSVCSVQEAHVVNKARSTFGISARPGVFTVTPVKAEGLPVTSLFRVGRASLMIQLVPYEEQIFAPAAIGPDFMWNAPVHLKHTDTTRERLLLFLQIIDDPLVGTRRAVGFAVLPLQLAVDTSGTTVTRWFDVKRTSGAAPDNEGGRIMVSICFHPKVSKGPTVHKLLQDMVQEEQPRPASPTETARRTPSNALKPFSKKSKTAKTKLQAALHQQTHRQAKGRFTFALNGIHLCGNHCSSVNGHSISSSREFSPIVRVKFDDFEHELRVGASDCDIANYEHEWPVYSCFSQVEVEILRKVSISAGPVQKLLDGSQAVKVCSVTISCHEIQERNAAMWTMDPPVPTLGPGRSAPHTGFDWYPLSLDDDDIGLAHIYAEYTEDYAAIMSTEESSDMPYIYPDERSFDPMIIQRNFERLDEIYMTFKSLKTQITEILDWKNPLYTLFVWMGINLCCIYIPGAHLPSLLAFGVVVALLVNYVLFLLGHTHKKWIRRVNGSSGLNAFRPVGTLRLLPVCAQGLRAADGSTASPDTYVRVFYEPNYKTIPVHLIAQTECVRNTTHPNWSVSQAGARSRDEFLAMNNKWVKGMFRHLSSHERDAIAHDVVEPWPRADGQTDTHAFKYPVLQPVQKDQASGEEELIPWRNCPGTIRFDVIQENVAAQPVLVGRVRVPIKCLVNDETTGGPQVELEQTFPLGIPTRARKTKSPCESAPSTTRTPMEATASMTVRMQLILRDPRSRVTLKESLASEALYNVIEMENEKELTLVEKYHKAKDVAKNIQ